MIVKVKELNVEMDVKSKGITFGIADTKGKHLGNLILTNTGLKWLEGKKSIKNAKVIPWEEFVEYVEDSE